MHIDLQQRYWAPRNNDAYKTVNALSFVMRSFGIPNLWVSMSEDFDTPVTAQRFNEIAFAPYRFMEVAPTNDEIVLPKRRANAFDIESEHDFGRNNAEYIKDKPCNTFLIDGVYAHACVTITAIGLARAFAAVNRPINIIFVSDGIDLRVPAAEFTAEIQDRVGKMHKALHASSEEATETLECCAAPA